MPIDDLMERVPKQFDYIHRMMGYIMLSLIVIVYHYTSPNTNNQIFLPLVFLVFLIALPKISDWIWHRYGYKYSRYFLFVIDVLVLSMVLAALHLSIVMTMLGLFVLLYTAILNRIPFVVATLAILLGVFLFYICTIFIFGFSHYFEQTSIELTILGFLSLITYCGVGVYYQLSQIKYFFKQKNHYKEQMNRYMEFSNQLSRYAPVQLWQSIMNGESKAKIEYKRKKITVFFSDIQGFTELSETLIPDDLAFLLNDYLSHMTEIAKQYEGTVDKFMGDAILVFFGDPHSQGVQQDAKSCLEMAIAMRQQMKILRERWIKMGYPPLHIRMGISTGYCHVGNYGATHRMAYTIVGRDVNLASRLQSAADVDEILISQDTYNLVKQNYLCVPKPPIYLKGIQEPVQTWQIIEKHDEQLEEFQNWFDYEYKGFHLLLNMEEVQNYEYSALIEILEKMLARIKTQQEMTNSKGVVKLSLKDEIMY